MRATSVDLNIAGMLVMIDGDPGIKKARLYRTPRGREIFDDLVAIGAIAVDDHGGVSLTAEGRRIKGWIQEIIQKFGEEDLLEMHIEDMIEWYQRRIELNRQRYQKKTPPIPEEEPIVL